MKKNDVVIKVNPENREVYFNDNFAGVNAENLQSNLVFRFDGEFVNGTPRVEVEKDGEKYIITDVSKVEDTYVMEIKSSLLTTDVIWLQLVITEVGNEEIPIFKSRKFYLVVKESINADTELPDEYATLYDQIEEKIAEVENLNITGERVSDGVEITFTDKLGNETTEKVNDGLKGQDGKDGVDGFSPSATITQMQDGARIDIIDKNGTTTANIYNGDDYIITQQDYNTIANIVETDISPILETKADKSEIPTKTSDLTNDSNFAKTNQNNNFTTAQTVNGTLTVNGDIVQSGQSYETHAEQLFTKNDLIKTRDGAIGGLASNEVTGIEAINYDGANNGRLVFDNTGTARVGDVGDEVPLLGRDESINLTDGQVLVWDSTDLIAKGSSNYVKKTDYATQNVGGVSKMWTSYNEDGEIGLNISTQ